jgi:hypothetical protein
MLAVNFIALACRLARRLRIGMMVMSGLPVTPSLVQASNLDSIDRFCLLRVASIELKFGVTLT